MTDLGKVPAVVSSNLASDGISKLVRPSVGCQRRYRRPSINPAGGEKALRARSSFVTVLSVRFRDLDLEPTAPAPFAGSDFIRAHLIELIYLIVFANSPSIILEAFQNGKTYYTDRLDQRDSDIAGYAIFLEKDKYLLGSSLKQDTEGLRSLEIEICGRNALRKRTWFTNAAIAGPVMANVTTAFSWERSNLLVFN